MVTRWEKNYVEETMRDSLIASINPSQCQFEMLKSWRHTIYDSRYCKVVVDVVDVVVVVVVVVVVFPRPK